MSNQTLQLIGAFILALVLVLFMGALALMEQDIPNILDRGFFLLLGSFVGVSAANGVRVATSKKS